MGVGVDGCRDGWFCVFREGGRIEELVVASITDLFVLFPERMVAIDVPIGLPNSGPRRVDIEARRQLGERRSSVFPAPIRPTLVAPNRESASTIGEMIDGRRLSVQTWAIIPKIIEVDTLMRKDRTLTTRVHECHPEVCWKAMNQGRPMRFSKKSVDGRRERLALVDKHFGAAGRSLYDAAVTRYRRQQVALDDVLDSLACLWTAERLENRAASYLLQTVESDAFGIPMQMAF